MKKIFLSFLCMTALSVADIQRSAAQVILQKAVVSNGGGLATNGTTSGAFVAGQTAVGTASNSQMTGHFGFFATPNAAAGVTTQSAGPISSLALSPNPASNEVQITVALASSQSIDLFLYDASGKIISKIFSGKREAGSFVQRFDATSLPSGAYFIAARVPGALMQTKLNVVK